MPQHLPFGKGHEFLVQTENLLCHPLGVSWDPEDAAQADSPRDRRKEGGVYGRLGGVEGIVRLSRDQRQWFACTIAVTFCLVVCHLLQPAVKCPLLSVPCTCIAQVLKMDLVEAIASDNTAATKVLVEDSNVSACYSFASDD